MLTASAKSGVYGGGLAILALRRGVGHALRDFLDELLQLSRDRVQPHKLLFYRGADGTGLKGYHERHQELPEVPQQVLRLEQRVRFSVQLEKLRFKRSDLLRLERQPCAAVDAHVSERRILLAR